MAQTFARAASDTGPGAEKDTLNPSHNFWTVGMM